MTLDSNAVQIQKRGQMRLYGTKDFACAYNMMLKHVLY